MAPLNVTVWTMSWDSQKGQWDFSYFFSLDTLARPQWEAVVRGWGLASFLYDETMLVLCPDAGITAAAQRFIEHL